VFGYSTPPHELRAAIAARMQRLYGWSVDPGWIVFLPGVVPGLHLAARQLVARDGHALIPRPVYHHFKRAVELAPRRFTELALVLERGRWVFDLERIDPGATAFFLCNPQNPGGTVFRRAELERLAEISRDLVIVSDEIHCDLILDADALHIPIASLAPEVSNRTVTLMSASKTFNFPAAGCAWAIIENAALRRAFAAELAAHVLPSPSVFGYEATLAAFRGGDEWLAAQIEYLRANRDLVERSVALPLAHVEATYLAWIDCRTLGVADPQAFFLEHGVALSPGAQFGAPGFARLNFATQRARLAEALRRIDAAAAHRARP
jgi:bifunctional pyridoxal-dependent enzyme with beta-cystathionase and maltose regulon repressor activities